MLLSRHLIHINEWINTLTHDALRHILIAVSLSTRVGVSLACLSRAAMVGHCECTLIWPNFSPYWLYQLLVYVTVFASALSCASLCLIFNFFFFADLMHVRWSLINGLYLPYNEAEHFFTWLLAICVSSLLNYLFILLAFLSVMLFFLLLVEVVHCIVWLLILYESYIVQGSPRLLFAFCFVYGVFQYTGKFNSKVVNDFTIFIVFSSII